MVTAVTEKLVADTIAADVYISTVVVMEDTSTISVESTTRETILSGGERGAPGISEEDMVYAKRVDFVGDTLIYKAEAIIGSTNSSPAWRIRRITLASDNDIIEEWADGDGLFNNIWDNRLSLTYI